MQVFCHHLYEYEKGIRNLILHTISDELLSIVEKKLNSKSISYIIYKLKNGRANVFFGDTACINVIKSINKSNLSDYNAEEDFILGVLLGYDKVKQCDRYMEYKNKKFNRRV